MGANFEDVLEQDAGRITEARLAREFVGLPDMSEQSANWSGEKIRS